MHRVRARLLQAHFSSVASEVYLPDLVALPPISLRRRLLVNLMQALPDVATIFLEITAEVAVHGLSVEGTHRIFSDD